ncbi:hypothetical protein D9757_009007 [Collybiopsis confluens]|uniref:Uncharacterized protein n=1 Tax=Collybiopsis confluens TaxID=2823264 RepID=A0A8H5H2X2_9AGAR|nr:hypothetical protein D9757_009007 [Collybiopsis confluens]
MRDISYCLFLCILHSEKGFIKVTRKAAKDIPTASGVFLNSSRILDLRPTFIAERFLNPFYVQNYLFTNHFQLIAMQASAMVSTSAALYHVVTYLTRPLTAVYPARTVMQLQMFLYNNLATQFLAETVLSPFTLVLTPTLLPPTPLYAACLQSGVEWPRWIHALGGQVLFVCVMEDTLKVRIGEVGDVVTVWSDELVGVSTRTSGSPMAAKLQAMLDSVRARNCSADKSITVSSVLTSTTAADVGNDDDSESVSDTESTTSSSLFSETSSTSSISSTSSSPVTKSSTLPSVEMAAASKAPVYVPRHRRNTTFSNTTQPQLLSRSQRHLARTAVDSSKVDVCRYMYEGGQTSVMTGGVMLGAVKPTNATPAASKPKTKPAAKVAKGPNSSQNWRVRV